MGFGKDGKGVIMRNADSITLGALASGAAVKQGTPLAIEEDFRMLKYDVWLQIEGTIQSDEGWLIGIADNELSVTEIAEAIVVDGPLDRNDRLKEEQATRPVFVLGSMPQVGQGNHNVGHWAHIEGTLRWSFSDAEGFTLFAFNASGVPLTTGAVIKVIAKYYGVWIQ